MTYSLVTSADRTREFRSLQRANGWRRTLFWAAIPLALVLTAGNVSGQTTTWTNPGVGNWFVDSNWNLGVPQSGSVVQVNSIAKINNGGLALISDSGSVAVGLFVTLGDSSGSGFLDVNGAGRLTVTARLNVHNGALTIRRNNDVGAQVVVLDNPVIGGSTEIGQSGAGQVRVTGIGSFLGAQHLEIGADRFGTGPGVLEILNGGRVDSTQTHARAATVTVSGLNSVWSISESLSMGALNTSPQITVANRGTLNSNVTYMGNGAINVTGAGSSFSSGSSLLIGTGGSAALSVEAGGLVSSVNATLGRGAGTGIAYVYGAGSTWNVSSRLSIGGPLSGTGENDRGEVFVFDGGLLTSASAELATLANTVGFARVTGNNSRWINSGDLVVAKSGSADLQVINGGTLRTNRGFVGHQSGSRGSALVADGGSWIATGSFFIGNAGGSGELRIQSGGAASTVFNSYLGFGSGSTGTAVVTGAGSTWNTAGVLNIGGNRAGAGGTGLLSIENGGTVNAMATNLYNTGTLALNGEMTFTGPLTSFGGLIRTVGESTLANAVHLNAGGVSVDTATLATNTTFSGNIDGVGGLTKHASLGDTGKGTLILTGNNTYQGTTTVNAGTLLVNGTNTSATTVNEGTLGGIGAISGAVTIGNNAGDDDAIIAPGQSIGTLATGDFTLNADAVFAFELNSASSLADQIDVTGSVSLIADTLFSFTDLGSDVLTPGFSFTVINNDGADAIVGAFANLSEGVVFTDGANQYRASYLGGTGNDLVLKAIPEPMTATLFLMGLVMMLIVSRLRTKSHARNESGFVPRPFCLSRSC